MELVAHISDVFCPARHKTYTYADAVIVWLRETRELLVSTGWTILFPRPELDVPSAFVNDVTTVGFPFPDDTAIEQSVRFVVERHKLDQNTLFSIVSACRGMTEQRVEDRTAVAVALTAAAEEVVLVPLTDGLGPTPKELIHFALAGLLGTQLRVDRRSLDRIEDFFRRRNHVRALFPEGAQPIENTCGTAPGVYARLGQAEVYIMPGVPLEM